MLRRIAISWAWAALACACSQAICDELEPKPLDPAASQPASLPTSGPSKIAEFQGEYRFLSNFWPATVEFEGITYPTVEHAYQAAKTLDANERKRIAALPTPAEAKRAGRQLRLRGDWEQVKFDVMEQCVRYKFTHHPALRERLLGTGDAYLEEGNTWGDTVWGVSNGIGENRLGKTLMRVREALRRDAATTQSAEPSPRPSP